MRWDSLFADLEAQLDAATTHGLDAEVAERVRIEVGALTLADRLRGHLDASPGTPLTFRLLGASVLRGVVRDVGRDMCLLTADGGSQVLLPLRAVAMVAGLGRPARVEASVVQRRLGLRNALRGLARDRATVRVMTLNGEVTGTVDRVGADHLDIADRHRTEVSAPVIAATVSLESIVAVWSR
mgnify:CR=1 FL=1